jgi:hypothetical protein
MVEKDIRKWPTFLFRGLNMSTVMNKVTLFLFSYCRDLFSLMYSHNVYRYLVSDQAEFLLESFHQYSKCYCPLLRRGPLLLCRRFSQNESVCICSSVSYLTRLRLLSSTNRSSVEVFVRTAYAACSGDCHQISINQSINLYCSIISTTG